VATAGGIAVFVIAYGCPPAKALACRSWSCWHADSISFEVDDVKTLGDFAAEPLPDAQGSIVDLFLMLPEADGAFLEAATGCPGSPLRDDVGIGDFEANRPIENH
jgi:hypothetical protein